MMEQEHDTSDVDETSEESESELDDEEEIDDVEEEEDDEAPPRALTHGRSRQAADRMPRSPTTVS